MEHQALAEQHAEQAGNALARFHMQCDDMIADSDEVDGQAVELVKDGVTALVEVGLSIAQRIADATRH